VHGRRALVCSHSQVTTPSAPNDAFFNFGIRVERASDFARGIFNNYLPLVGE
jgi:hypothetical protein